MQVPRDLRVLRTLILEGADKKQQLAALDRLGSAWERLWSETERFRDDSKTHAAVAESHQNSALEWRDHAHRAERLLQAVHPDRYREHQEATERRHREKMAAIEKLSAPINVERDPVTGKAIRYH